ncbi:DUF4148 domain-containing protein [Burkholderia sp. L27(2015)]|uniref:DUF4148 domain-containing protein n=1 Tax=Burkholderia sp. L27(2015) TaxID=1641858 RepID=UPI00349EA431
MIAVSFAACATTSLAYAADYGQATDQNSSVASPGQPSPNSSTQPLSRAQVRAQLVQAQRSGELAYLNNTFYRGN